MYVKFLICNVAAWEKSSNLSCFSKPTLRHKLLDYTTYQYVYYCFAFVLTDIKIEENMSDNKYVHTIMSKYRAETCKINNYYYI